MQWTVLLLLSFACCLISVSAAFAPLVLPGKHSVALRSSTTDYLDKVREGIVEAGLEEDWKSATETLSTSIGIDLPEAEASLAQALNWKSWAVCKSNIARKYIKPLNPDVEIVKSSLQWLREGPLALDSTVLRKAILEYPQAYLTSPEATYKQALSVAPSEYKSPDVFRELLLKDPAVLQCTYNCADDGCASECGNCWVTFRAS